MPRFSKTADEGREVVVETSLPREAAQLRAQGFTESVARTKATRVADGVTAEAKPSK